MAVFGKFVWQAATLVQIYLWLWVLGVNGAAIDPYSVNWTGVNASLDHLITLENPSTRLLRNYVRIRTAPPDLERGYRQAIIWLEAVAKDIGLGFKVADLGPDNLFAVILTWPGTEPKLKSILFNGHMDVVDVEPEFWTYPAFDAFKDSNGNIFGRGTSDMKSATIATLEAIRKLKKSGWKPRRTVHVTILPDEETGGLRGMGAFVATEHFKVLNVGIDVDEGGVNPEPDVLRIYYGEKSSWAFRITAIDQAWHGSRMPNVTSVQRLQFVIDKLMKFRQDQLARLQNPEVKLNQLTSINLVRIGGGIGPNTIPSKLWGEFDMRLPRTDFSFAEMEQMLRVIVEQAKQMDMTEYSNVKLEFTLKSLESVETVADDSNVWWGAIQQACGEMGIKCPATFASPVSDSRFVRAVGIPVFGIGPFLSTPFKAHTNNEFINEHEFLKGIERYAVLIRYLAMLPTEVRNATVV